MLVLIRGILLQFINKFSLFFKNQSRYNYKGTESFHVRYLWMLAGFSAKLAKNLWLGNFFKSSIEYKDTKKKYMKIRRSAFCEERKRFSFQIHLIIISRDFLRPTGRNMTCVHRLTQATFEFKDFIMQPKY